MGALRAVGEAPVTSYFSYDDENEMGSDAGYTDWSPDCWRLYPAYQMPNYPDKEELASVEAQLRGSSPLVFAGECRQLFAKIAAAQQGKAFVLMGGDCAESFDEFNVDKVRDTFR